MAFLAATPAILDGLSVGTAAAIGVTAASGIMAANSARAAGQAQAAQYQQQAQVEAMAAKQTEIERRRDLIRALSSQNAAAGAAGITTDGSVGAIVRRNINENQNDLSINAANSAAKQRLRISQASNAVRTGNAQAVTSLLDTGVKAYGML